MEDFSRPNALRVKPSRAHPSSTGHRGNYFSRNLVRLERYKGWGPDGRLCWPRQFVGDVVAIDVDNGTFEVVADGFGRPGAVKFDHQGRMHVLDPLNGEIVHLWILRAYNYRSFDERTG